MPTSVTNRLKQPTVPEALRHDFVTYLEEKYADSFGKIDQRLVAGSTEYRRLVGSMDSVHQKLRGVIEDPEAFITQQYMAYLNAVKQGFGNSGAFSANLKQTLNTTNLDIEFNEGECRAIDQLCTLHLKIKQFRMAVAHGLASNDMFEGLQYHLTSVFGGNQTLARTRVEECVESIGELGLSSERRAFYREAAHRWIEGHQAAIIGRIQGKLPVMDSDTLSRERVQEYLRSIVYHTMTGEIGYPTSGIRAWLMATLHPPIELENARRDSGLASGVAGEFEKAIIQAVLNSGRIHLPQPAVAERR